MGLLNENLNCTCTQNLCKCQNFHTVQCILVLVRLECLPGSLRSLSMRNRPQPPKNANFSGWPCDIAWFGLLRETGMLAGRLEKPKKGGPDTKEVRDTLGGTCKSFFIVPLGLTGHKKLKKIWAWPRGMREIE